jgi:hypothetical protein
MSYQSENHGPAMSGVSGELATEVATGLGWDFLNEIPAGDRDRLETVEAEMAELAVYIRGLTGDKRGEELPGKLALVRALADERRVLAQGPVVVPLGPRKTVDRIDVTNAVFLEAVFGDQYPRAHCAAFKEDPYDLQAQKLSWKWGGDAFPQVHFEKGQNQYFTVSLFKREPGDKSRRRKTLFEGLYVLMLDDIGSGASAKVSPEVLKNLLRPSYALMTSPENHQCGFLLEWPETERGRAEALINGMVEHGLATDGKDPGQRGVTRYAKLPESHNTKSYYVDAASPAGYEARMIRWSPELIYTVDEIAACLGLVLPRPGSAEAKGIKSSSSMIDRYSSLGLTMADDPLLQVLGALGMVLGRTPSDEGWNITCPKVHEHTGRDDSGTALLDDGRLVCHHGHAMGYDLAWKSLRQDPDRSDEDRDLIERHYAKIVALEFSEETLVTLADAVDTPFSEWQPEVLDALAVIKGTGVAPDFQDKVLQSVPESERLDFEIELDGLVARVLKTRESLKTESVSQVKAEPVTRKKTRFLDPESFRLSLGLSSWLVDGFIPEPNGTEGEAPVVGIMYGPSGAGKSFCAVHLALAVARGIPWFGRRVSKSRVAYIAAEDARGVANRTFAYRKHFGMSTDEMQRSGLILASEGPRFGMGASGLKEARELAEDIIEAGGARLIIVDTLSSTFAGDENSAQDAREYVEALKEIARATGAVVMFIHHTGKADADPRGSSLLTADMDFKAKVGGKSHNGVFGVSDPRWVNLEKVKNGEANLKLDFGLSLVDIQDAADDFRAEDRVNADGTAKSIIKTSCIIQEANGGFQAAPTVSQNSQREKAEAALAQKTKMRRKALEAIQEVIESSKETVGKHKTPRIPKTELRGVPEDSPLIGTDAWVGRLEDKLGYELSKAQKQSLYAALDETGLIGRYGRGRVGSRTWILIAEDRVPPASWAEWQEVDRNRKEDGYGF